MKKNIKDSLLIKFSKILVLCMVFVSCSHKQDKKLTSFVNPFIGTGAHGHTFPGATVPFGMVQLSPDTRTGNWDACSGYHYSDTSIIGFSHTHLSGTGAIDLGDILFRPTNQEVLSLVDESNKMIPTPFQHSNEYAEPGYYSVTLDEEKVKCELTVTERTGIHRYTFSEKSDPRIVIDLTHELGDETRELQIASISESEITGYRFSKGWSSNQKLFFVIRFSQPMKQTKIWSKQAIVEVEFPFSSDDIRLEAVWEATNENVIQAQVAISGVSIEGARKNLNAESIGFDFDKYRLAASEKWDEELQTIQINDNSEENKKVFYTALYRSLIAPITISDVDGNYRGVDDKIYSDTENNHYTALSLWDTFRAWNPLMTLKDEAFVNEMINSMLAFYKQSGELPIWPLWSSETETMIGYHSVSVIVDAWRKGIRSYDARLALEAMIASSNTTRKGNDLYRELGYIPSNFKRESISCLLEYAYNDWCISLFAADIGRDDIAEKYSERALQYKNVFDGNTLFFRGKKEDGNWTTPFNTYEVSRDMTEATAWQYRFFVPHDINGLINLFGSKEAFINALDDLFNAEEEMSGHLVDITGLIGQYAHGNEPSHHMAYLYSYLGQPWKTQYYINKIQNEMYSNTPEGIAGNEDCGQMSAWHIMSSLGFYPVCPGSNEYILTTPRFEEMVFKLSNDKLLKIETDKDPLKNPYIKQVHLNGELLESMFITHHQMVNGGSLSFELSDTPQNDVEYFLPYSLTPHKEVSVPYVTDDIGFFLDSCQVAMGVATKGADIYYTFDGSEPTKHSIKYEGPFTITEDKTIKMRSFKAGMEPSTISVVKAKKNKLFPTLQRSLVKNGVHFKYFEGEFNKVADMKDKSPLQEGWISDFLLDNAVVEDHFGYMYDCYIQVPEDGIYEFYTESDDGSVLWIDGQEVVNNDGSHGAVKNTGRIGLKKGTHKLEVHYFEDYEGHSLEVGVGVNGKEGFKFQPEDLWR
ncbi:GH92 family glycosyl hydrolase [Aestuariivivens sediminicola]|uniref:GH92 family glycosyl hydrolase n=1 Tax=Aestuariivivens sediminicola TaxID=2913560 RepID=UPI001F597BE0|nr:GH92 family glycosyl hydrolase [Aestuariivivens sediminicola]